MSEITAKQSSLNSYRSSPGAEAKAYGAEMSLKRHEDAAEVVREQFASVSQRILREMDRFKREKAEDMKRTVFNYITIQIEYNKKMEDIWAKLLPQLEGGNVGNEQKCANVVSHGNSFSSVPLTQPTLQTSDQSIYGTSHVTNTTVNAPKTAHV